MRKSSRGSRRSGYYVWNRASLIVLLVLFLVEPSENTENVSNKNVKSSNQQLFIPSKQTKTDVTGCRCDAATVPKRCQYEQSLEIVPGECCPRCVCKHSCPELNYDICTRGFKPQREIASPNNGHPCCDTIICVSASSHDDLTINIKGSSHTDFYIDGDDDEQITSDDVDDDFDDLAYSGPGSSLANGGGNDGHVINITSIQYDSNQVIDDRLAWKARTASIGDAGSGQVVQLPKFRANQNDASVYEDQIRIEVKSEQGGEDYYLEDKDFGANYTNDEICHQINCQHESFVKYKETLSCPEDSKIRPTNDIEQHCCQTSAKCECSPCDLAPKLDKRWCDVAGENFEPFLLKRGESVPGKCCDSYICRSANLTCNYKGERYSQNSEWRPDSCTRCTCFMGVISCKREECTAELECDVKETLESECCPVCTGECRSDSGLIYKPNDSWREDNDCTECKCVNGRKQCLAEFCKPAHCPNPVKKPGLCCRVCEDETPNEIQTGSIIPWEPNLSNYPPHCKTKIENLKCTTQMMGCKYGAGIIALDGNRCPTCRCAERAPEICTFKCDDPTWTHMPLGDRLCRCPPPLVESKCTRIDNCKRNELPCPNGPFQKDRLGCDLCACQNNNLGEISSSENANYCQDAETGVTIADGKVWFDGCRQCLCQRGVQYCSLIACKMPSACPSQLFTSIKKSNTCCPMCPFSTNETSLGNTTICEPFNTAIPNSSGAGGGRIARQMAWNLDKCTKCMCLGGVLLCSVNKCPPVTCLNPIRASKTNPSNIEYQENSDECCPRCPSVKPSIMVGSLLSRTSENRPNNQEQTTRRWSCIDSSENYREHGAAWKETDCLHCMCHDGQVKCFNHALDCPTVSACKNEVRRKGECCSVCLDFVDVPFNLTSVYLNRSYFESKSNWPQSSKILVLVLIIALLLALFLILVSICAYKKILQRRKPRHHYIQHQQLKINNKLTATSTDESSGGDPQSTRELIVKLDHSPGTSLRTPGTMTPRISHHSSQKHHHHHNHHHVISNSTNRLNSHPDMNYSIKTAGDGGELSKPLLGGGGGGPKKYVISSRTNLNANHSGSEISESSTNNDENSKMTLLTGFSEQGNNNNNSNNTNNANRVNYNLPPAVNSQICYF